MIIFASETICIMKKIVLFLLMSALVVSPAFAREKEKAPKNEKVKNVILLIGDGMGLAHVATWMISQDYGPTAFDRAQFVGVSKTYSANNRVTDSAASATTMATGHKTNNGMLGMLPDGTEPENIGELARAKGIPMGIIATSYVLDATPGAFYAHAANRGHFKDIMEDLIALKPAVLVGGGRRYFTDEKYTGGENMIDKAVQAGFTYCETPEQFYETEATPILGLFSEGSYPMVIERDSDFLADALNHTLDIFGKSKKGFFIMAEGSHIDHAAHANNAEQMVFEMEEFDKAVNAAFDYADTHKGTLVIVTADHETGGVTLLSGDRDYTKGESGINVTYSTNGHSGSPVLIYSYGASAWKFGRVMENTAIFDQIKELLF